MIIANHIPIGVSPIGSEMEWWGGDKNAKPGFENAVDLAGLVKTLQDTPNLLMWIAGHRHMNVVKAFPSADPSRPEQGFWQVETSSLRDFPQQFRTFRNFPECRRNNSIVTTNVDPAVAEGTPAAKSRAGAVAANQIVRKGAGIVFEWNPTQDGSIRKMPTGSYNAELLKTLSPAMKQKMKALFPVV